MTARKTCKYCAAQIITVRSFPPLNAKPDAAGTVAIYRGAGGTVASVHWITQTQRLVPGEQAYRVHECDGTRRQAQRGQWASARSAHAAGQRRRRAGPGQRDMLPGVRIWPGGEK